MCWKPEYVILIIASTLINFFAGAKMGQIESKTKRKKYLLFSIVTNIGILFSFKYFNFFNDSLRAIFNHYNVFYSIPKLNVLLPVGISFYTFQALSYSIDVYRGDRKTENNLAIFALYVSFFPQLVAGPIERSTRLLPQFYQKFTFDYQRVTDGLKLMLWGFFEKLVIADRLAVLVDQVYNNAMDYNGIPLILATYFFAFQIYCDFSGYSNIAIGAAQVMGFNLTDNFRRPYFSESIAEFWRRWHISLSFWFRDYIYIPLGGNRVVKYRWFFNLFVVFLVTGFWHGANWTFVIWGVLHGFYIMFSILTSDLRNRISNFFHLNQIPTVRKILKVIITFHLVLFSWIFFRANSVNEAFYIISHLFSGLEFKISYGLTFGITDFVIAIGSILLLEFIHLLQRHWRIRHSLSGKPIWFRWAIYYAIVFGILILGKFGSQEFIYFQF